MIGASVRRAAAAGGLALVLGVSGCSPGAGEPPAPAATSAPSLAVRAAPALCGAPQPAYVEPFPYNRDAYRRDRIVGASTYLGGTARFSRLDHVVLASLIEQRFLDPYERQNLAPSAWEILQFLCQHRQVRAAGYVVSLDRDDYRTTIEAERLCADADEVVFEDELECFWD